MIRARRRFALGAIVACGLIAGTPLCAQSGPVADDPAGTCAAMATMPWSVAGKTYQVSASAGGSSCGMANVTMQIRAPTGRTMLTVASAAADLASLFKNTASPAGMTAALKRWVEQPTPGRTMRDMPAWETGADRPKGGDGGPYQIEPLITRANYMDRRRWGQPLFCFMQGRMAQACYALDTKTDSLTLIATRPFLG